MYSLTAYEAGEQMEEKGLGRRINAVRKCRGFTSERLSELWESTSPDRQEIAAAMIRAVLELENN